MEPPARVVVNDLGKEHMRNRMLLAQLVLTPCLVACGESGVQTIQVAAASGSPVPLSYRVDERGNCFAGFRNEHQSTKADDVMSLATIACSDAVRSAASKTPPLKLTYFRDAMGLCYGAFLNLTRNTQADDVAVIASVPCADQATAPAEALSKP